MLRDFPRNVHGIHGFGRPADRDTMSARQRHDVLVQIPLSGVSPGKRVSGSTQISYRAGTSYSPRTRVTRSTKSPSANLR